MTAVSKSAARPASKPKKTKKVNLSRLYTEMIKFSNDAVDKEVIKRFKIIIDTYEEDITKKSLMQVIKDSQSVDISSFPEILQPYIKHYIFLSKRNSKKK